MELTAQYKQLLQRLSADEYVDMSGQPTSVTIALEDMEFDGLIEEREPGCLEYRLTPKGAEVKRSL
jgi:DNA-binding PadR family transcriptional regulator